MNKKHKYRLISRKMSSRTIVMPSHRRLTAVIWRWEETVNKSHFTFLQDFLSIQRRMRQNDEAIREYNAALLPRVQLIACAVLFLPLLMSILVPRIWEAFSGYLPAFCACVLLYWVFSKEIMRRHALAGFYLLFFVLLLLVFFLSFVTSPERPASSVLAFFITLPLLFIDKPLRLYTLSVALFILHTVLSYSIKGPEIGGIDLMNCFASMTLGILIGSTMQSSQLDIFEARRQLTREKETDVLTGLSNRRKLFETLALLRSSEKDRPNGVLMADIDHFKLFNDRFGHGAGDICLKHFGTALLELEQEEHCRFFRYGGEEFVAFLWKGDKARLAQCAEHLRSTVSRMHTGEEPITLSIGTVFCDDPAIINFETWIDRADQAAYEAKALGRNRVVCWNELQAK